MEHSYIAIDLKSFYASVECIERGLDPLTTNLVVADPNRTEKTICLAVTPSLKSYGISGRARLFEVVQRVNEVNAQRQRRAPGKVLTDRSSDNTRVRSDPAVALDYIVAPPRMAHYMDCSARIFDIYLKYVSAEDIHPYSIDEVFIDVTHYLGHRGCTARELAMTMIQDVLRTTGITATAGVGSNLYLCKIAMDVEAKKMPPDKDGVRIAELDERTYREKLWDHRPLTDFWRVGRGYADKLEARGIRTMGDIARTSLSAPGQAMLYKLFGVNAELLIDHAWGWEPCTIKDIKSYRPKSSSITSGQVLQTPYPFDKARLVTREMLDMLALDLVSKHLVADQIVLTVGYDVENLQNPAIAAGYTGEVTVDGYGRSVPKHAHGTANLGKHTSSAARITDAALALFDRVVNPGLLVRRISLDACGVVPEDSVDTSGPAAEQLSLFDEALTADEAAARERERRRQEAVLNIRAKYGKNAILKGTNFEDGATGRDRNRQIGGHKA